MSDLVKTPMTGFLDAAHIFSLRTYKSYPVINKYPPVLVYYFHWSGSVVSVQDIIKSFTFLILLKLESFI